MSLLSYSESCIYQRIEVEKPSSLCYSHAPVQSPEKLGICHARRPVLRDRRILVMEMEAGKSTYVAYLLQKF